MCSCQGDSLLRSHQAEFLPPFSRQSPLTARATSDLGNIYNYIDPILFNSTPCDIRAKLRRPS